ncbi:peroxide operon regulator [bacterium BMS3Abin01]|nr:peroxide operon regulator [bacterium BMS3Abin01]
MAMTRLTPQRAAILEYLDGNTDHPSAEDIYRAVRRRYPMISLATVYNTLDALKQEDAVMELSIDTARKRYDPDTRPHNHLICTTCKRIVDIRVRLPLRLPKSEQSGFKITGKHVEFYGLCPDCQDAQV